MNSGLLTGIATATGPQYYSVSTADQILKNSNIYNDYPGLDEFVSKELILEGSKLTDRYTVDIKKMVAADKAGKPIYSYLNNLKGVYGEHLANEYITGKFIKEVSKQ